jgi:hypothetical protein
MVDYDSAAHAVQDEHADPAFLARIAYENPEFGPNVAAHPRAYPGLLAWLAQFGTDQARAIVAQRAADLPAEAHVADDSVEPASHDSDIPLAMPQDADSHTKKATTVPVNAADPQGGDDTAHPTHGFSAAQALDPTTDPMTQHNIAEYAPELRVYLAQNPSVYPELLEWLKSLDDPAITAAIAARH